jgi:hypothetical protein
MRLMKVEPSQAELGWIKAGGRRNFSLTYRCVGCGDVITYDDRRGGVFADLDGRPFKDYYCGKCAEEVQPSTTTKTTGA